MDHMGLRLLNRGYIGKGVDGHHLYEFRGGMGL